VSWRGQGGGKRARSRRGDQDPELDNTAWLAELERAAGEADDDEEEEEEEEDWASKLRRGRSPGPPSSSPPPADPAPPLPGPPPSAAEPSWMPQAEPPPTDHPLFGMDPEPTGGSGSNLWDAGWDTQESPSTPDRDRGPDPTGLQPPAFDQPGQAAKAEPPAFGEPGRVGQDPQEFGELRRGAPDPGEPWVGDDPDGGFWRSAGVDTPTGAWAPVEPADREPDYPALFGELYRRSSAQQDPIWEAPPVAEPLPEPSQPDPSGPGWPFQETTQTWEPSDRSFEWPAEELPSTSSDWEPTPPSWLDDPSAQPSAWSNPSPPAPAVDNGGPPTQAFDNGFPAAEPQAPPPPADWAAAIPADVPAARRAQPPDLDQATRVWRPDEVAAEPAVPLGMAERPAAAATPAPAEQAETRRTQRPEGRRIRQADDGPSRSWPRVVAVVSWIVLVMVVCWFYVFPWLERVLPENF
jgi:hypothetical protein